MNLRSNRYTIKTTTITNPMVSKMLFLIVLLLSSACQPQTKQTSREVANDTADPAPTSTGSETAGELYFICNEGNIAAYESLAEEFHTVYPNIRVHVRAIEPFLEQAGIATDPLKRWAPMLTEADVVGWSMEPELSRLGLVRDLTPFMEADHLFDRSDFYPFMLEHYQWDNSLWALPAWAIPEVIFYNKDVFDRAGLSYPQPGWDQEAFWQTVAQLTQREGNKITQYGYVDSGLLTFLPLMRGLATGAPFEPQQFDTPEIANALNDYKAYISTYATPPIEYDAVIKSGRAAMWGGYLVNWESMRKSGLRNLGVAAFPMGTQPANLFSSPTAYFMSSGTPYPQESWLWMKFLTEHRINDRYGSMNMALPSRRSVTEESGYWAQWAEEESGVMRFIVEHPMMVPWTTPYLALKRAADAVRAGKAPEEALPDIQEQAAQAYRQAAQLTPMTLPPRAEVSADAIPVIFTSYGIDDAYYRALADAFNTQQTAIRVAVTPPQSAQAADCYVGDADVAQQGNALNLQPFAESTADLRLADFAFVDDFRVQGDLYGLPAYGVAAALFYNPVLFDAAGLSYPAPGWTLDDFLRAAQTLSHGAGEARQYGFASLSGDAAELPLFAALQGVALWSDDGQPRFDAPEAVAAVAWYADLARKYQVAPQSENLPEISPADMQQRRQLIQSGRVAMWTGLLGLGQAPLSLATGNAGIAPLPGGYARTFPIGLFIARDTAHAAACWQWFAFAAANAPFAPELGLPAYRPATQDADALAPYRPLLDASPLAFATGDDNQQRALLEALAQIYAGSSSQAALAEAQQKAARLP